MKKAFILITVLSMCLSASAQEIFDNLPYNMRLSVQAGINISTISYQSTTYSAKTCWQLGVNAEIPLADKFAGDASLFLYPGFYYITKGAKDKLKTSGGSAFGSYSQDITTTFSLDYLQVPVRIGLRDEYSNTAWSVYLGPYFAYGLSGKSKMDGSMSWGKGSSGVTSPDTDLFKNDYFKRFDLGYTFGIRFEVLKWKAFADFSMEESLINDNKNMTYIKISLGYRF